MFKQILKFKNVSLMLGMSTPKMISILKERNVILNTNGRNLPSPNFVRKGWFQVDYIAIDEKEFKAIVPTVCVTTKGFYEIERILNENMFEEVPFNNLYDTVQLAISEFLRGRNGTTIRKIEIVNNERGLNVIYQRSNTFTTILKYDKNLNKIWQPKLTN